MILMRAVITGATSGIGKAMACQLAQDGWSLVLTGRNQTVLEQLQKNLPTAVEILPLDLAEEEAPYQLFDFCKKKRVDLLVNNAGFGIFGRFTETNLQEEMDLLAVNLIKCILQPHHDSKYVSIYRRRWLFVTNRTNRPSCICPDSSQGKNFFVLGRFLCQ